MLYCTCCVVVLALVCYVLNWLWRKPFVGGINKKAVFITGCDSGLGRVTALYLDSKGVPVFAGCLTEDGAKSLRQEASERLQTVSLDVTDQKSITNARQYIRDNLPRDGTVLWGVINNAGILGPVCPAEWHTKEAYEAILRVNVTGPVLVSLTFIPELIRSQGRLVNVTSICSFIKYPYLSLYSLGKSALQSFTDTVRVDKQLNTYVHTVPPIEVARTHEHALFARNPKDNYLVGPLHRFTWFIGYLTPRLVSEYIVTRAGMQFTTPQRLKKDK